MASASVRRVALEGFAEGALVEGAGDDTRFEWTKHARAIKVREMDRWSVFAVFVVMFGLLGMALPLFPPTNALLCRLACEPGQTYELVHQDTGIESTRSFACVNPDGGHRSLSGDNSPAETRAALVNIGTASVLAAIASWLLWRRFRRRPPTP